MGSTLAAVHAALRLELDDVAETVWVDANIDAAITDALADLSRYVPREVVASVVTVAADRDLDIVALTARIRVVAVELPTGNFPKTYRRFSIFGDTLEILDDPAPDGTNANVYYDAVHANTAGTLSLPVQYDGILQLGAAWKACLQKKADTSNAINDGGLSAPRDWDALAEDYRRRYEAERNPLRGIQVSRMYAPVEPLPTQDSDPGP